MEKVNRVASKVEFKFRFLGSSVQRRQIAISRGRAGIAKGRGLKAAGQSGTHSPRRGERGSGSAYKRGQRLCG